MGITKLAKEGRKKIQISLFNGSFTVECPPGDFTKRISK
jgi:hypothetical protein